MRGWPALGFGVGLRPEHYSAVESGIDARLRIDWFEALTENYLETEGRAMAVLEHARRDRPVALHGVALSIGSTDPLDRTYLHRLKKLVDRIQPALVTDHLCWTGVAGRSLYDLLPLPGTEEAVAHVARRVEIVQQTLNREIALENPASYFAFRHSTLTPWEFHAEVARRADCGILLDVTNVQVSSRNLGLDARAWIDGLPPGRIAQIHLAGFRDLGTHLFDTHDAAVAPEVWTLYRRAVERFGRVATLVEWDAEIPSLERLAAEASTARTITEDADEERNAAFENADPQGAAALAFRADHPSVGA